MWVPVAFHCQLEVELSPVSMHLVQSLLDGPLSAGLLTDLLNSLHHIMPELSDCCSGALAKHEQLCLSEFVLLTQLSQMIKTNLMQNISSKKCI